MLHTPTTSPPPPLPRLESHLQAQRNIPIPILIILLKHIRHPLQTDTRLDKKVEAEGIPSTPVVRLVQQSDEALG
jgi:hypothetical protein